MFETTYEYDTCCCNSFLINVRRFLSARFLVVELRRVEGISHLLQLAVGLFRRPNKPGRERVSIWLNSAIHRENVCIQ